MVMSITETTNKDYDDHVKFWEKADDVYNERIKQKGLTYLPGSSLPSGLKGCEELISFLAKKYTNETLPMAVFYNFTNLTLSAAIGAIMRKPPTYKFADEERESGLDYLKVNADGKGNGLDQVAKKLLTSQYMKSRGGLLVSIPELTNMADLQSGKVAPRLVHYDALNILDWAAEWDNGNEYLVRLLLKEVTSGVGDKGESIQIDRLIEFKKVDGAIEYKISEDGEGVKSGVLQKGGVNADKIPFFLASSVNNDWDIDPTPMRTLIELNLLHYIMMSRDMQGRYDLAQLQLSVDIGSDPNAIGDFSKLNPNGIIAGSSVAVVTKGGKVDLIQSNESNLLSSAPKEIEEKAVRAGAQLLQDSGGNETATAATMRAGTSTATMSSIAKNCGDCIKNAIVELAGYIGIGDAEIKDVEFSLNNEFFSSTLSAQDKQAYLQMVQQGVFPIEAYYNVLRKSGELDDSVTYQDYLEQLRENVNGSMPNVSGDE
jgi:hypothetical protein